jgi:hypothetical protein
LNVPSDYSFEAIYVFRRFIGPPAGASVLALAI